RPGSAEATVRGRTRCGATTPNLGAIRPALRRCTGSTDMSGFSAAWLALRESFDLRARNPEVLEAIDALLGSRPAIRVADLGCGTGSTVRALCTRLPVQQHWNLFDNDASLLAIARNAVPVGNIELTATQLDLSDDLETAIGAPFDLITMSALLDLVSENWLQR